MRNLIFFLLLFGLNIQQVNAFESFEEMKASLFYIQQQIENGSRSDFSTELLEIQDFLESASSFNPELYCISAILLDINDTMCGDLYLKRSHLYHAIDIYKKRSQKFNSDYTRQLLLNLAQVENWLRNHDQALNIFHQTQIMFEEDNDFGVSYYVMLFCVAKTYIYKKDYLSAKIYMDEAIDVYNKLNGDFFETTNCGELMLLNQYGEVNMSLKDYVLAEKCFSHVIKVLEEKNAKSEYHIFKDEAYTGACGNLATIYFLQRDFEKAYRLLEPLKDENNDKNYALLQNKLVCSSYLNNHDKTLTHLRECNHIAQNNALDVISQFSEYERDNYWSDISWRQIVTNNFVATITKDPQIISEAYENELFYRRLMLRNETILEDLINLSNNQTLKDKFSEYKELRTNITYKKNHDESLQQMVNRSNSLEHDILHSVPLLKDFLQNIRRSCKDVQEALDENDIAIEFTYIPEDNFSRPERHYGAFVLAKNFESPKFVVLDEDVDVDKKLMSEDYDELFLGQLYSDIEMKALYQMIWSKLSSFIKDGRNVYYSPVGSLTSLNFDLLMDEIGTVLGNKVNLIRVSSTGDIEEVKRNSNKRYGSSCLYGNISYDLTSSRMAEESSKYNTFSGEDVSSSLASRSINDRGKWGLLPYTKNEIDSIRYILNSNDISVSVWEGGEGNEESFKQFSGNSPHIIHLATHGFVVDTQQKAEGNKFIENTFAYSQREGYLTWCGLMMAGSNNAWTGNFNLENVEDGILTADEISRLDLSNTKLVVLSACETARGKIDPVEGVLGLQRAFKKAGAQTIVMSLWKVPDESTSILMTQFYKNLMTGIERHQALKDAMNYVKTLYPDPYYWAGFIMLD